MAERQRSHRALAISSVRQALRNGAARLAASGIEQPGREARLLLAEATQLSQADLLREPERDLDAARFDAMIARRAVREPLAAIVGWQEFWSLRFAVSPATLIPRADSETLIEAALGLGRPVTRILDLGTGTGCLLLAALSEFPGATGLGVDRNPDAAALARRNAAALGLDGRARFVAADWAAPIAGSFDLILANPPYIDSADIATLMPEVARFEPRAALDGGADGLDAYRALIPELTRLLAAEGTAILELGQGQAPRVTALACRAGFAATLRADLAGIARALILSRA